MYQVSQEYRDAMRRPVQRSKIRGTVGEVPFTEEHILSGSFSITAQCSDASNVQIGQVYTNELKITLMNSLPLSRYTLMGSEIVPYFGLCLSDGAYEYIPLGVYTVSEASWAASGVEITAYDSMSKLDRSFASSNLSGTPYELLSLACESCGLELNMMPQSFSSFANGTRELVLYEDNDINTWRDFVSWVAQALCCNVFSDRGGKIVLRAYARNVSDTIDERHRFTGGTFGDYETHYTGLSVVDMKNQATSYYSEAVDDGLTYNLGSNPFLQDAPGGSAGDMCLEILSAMQEIRYVPFSVEMIGNPVYDLMDILRFEGGLADGTRISCITKYTFRFHGKYSVSGVGTNPALTSAKSKGDKDLSGLMAQVSSITSSINRLIYDYNTGPVTVGQDERTLGMVTYHISQKADVEGHFLLDYTASESTHLTLRFYDQGVEELYSPVEMDILEGEGSIGIPHAYLSRGVGIHSVYVTAQVLSGSLSVDTRGVFFTVNAGNFAEPVDDIAMDVRDITMRQLLESSGPDQIWIAGIEDQKLLVSYRDYNDSYTTGPVWTGVTTEGDAIDAAIEFDGDWILRDEEDNFTILTEDQPWVFWVTSGNELYGKKGEDDDSRVLLDTGVTTVSACRGYSSIYYPEQDQGLVVAYLKGGKPYYRQYILDTDSGEKRWLNAELLSDETTECVKVHRLNDYRLGFELSGQGRNIWLYTDRTFVAQAVPREILKVSSREGMAFLYCPKDTDLSISFELTVSDDRKTIFIGVNRELLCYWNEIADYIAFSEGSVEPSDVESITLQNFTESALITICLKTPPPVLTMDIFFNPEERKDLLFKIGNYGTVSCPSETFTVDTTVYRRMSLKEEIIESSTGASISYVPYGELRQPMEERETFAVLSSSIQYIAAQFTTYELPADEVPISCTSNGIVYTQSGVTPV